LGDVPKCAGITIFGRSSRVATAASAGPMVKWSPIGRIAISGAYSSAIRAMSPNTAVSPAW